MTDGFPSTGEKLGIYRIGKVLGNGAVGRVFEASAESGPHPRVAIKIMHPQHAGDETSRLRFLREFETASELDHPHIIRLFEQGALPDGRPYIVMERLHGRELSEELAARAKLSLAESLQIAARVSEALCFAHASGLVHRDLKPGNIFLCPNEDGFDVRVLDFGSVKMQMETGPKLTGFGATLGSPCYMSPEQARGRQDLDNRSDLFALASVFYEMLTGQVAYGGGAVGEILMKVLRGTPEPLSSYLNPCPAALEDAFERAWAKDKAARFPTVDAFIDAAAHGMGLGEVAAQPIHTRSLTTLTTQLEHAAPAQSLDDYGLGLHGSGRLSGPKVLLGLAAVVAIAVGIAVAVR